MIVSKNLADRYWPGEDPIGKRLKWGIAVSPAPWQTVVGVAGDVVDGPLGSDPVIHVYSPYSETTDQGLASPIGGLWRRMNIAVNGDVDAASLDDVGARRHRRRRSRAGDRQGDDDEGSGARDCRRRSGSARRC